MSGNELAESPRHSDVLVALDDLEVFVERLSLASSLRVNFPLVPVQRDILCDLALGLVLYLNRVPIEGPLETADVPPFPEVAFPKPDDIPFDLGNSLSELLDRNHRQF